MVGWCLHGWYVLAFAFFVVSLADEEECGHCTWMFKVGMVVEASDV